MNDQDWMQDLFERSRREPEPAWTPDTAAIAIGGRRRRRLRAASVGGGALGALAVTAAVVIGLGGFTTSASVRPTTTPPRSTSVFDYASITLSGSDNARLTLPVSAVDRMSALIDTLDPGHAHLRSMRPASSAPGLRYQTVGDGSSALKGITTIIATSVYTADGTVPAPRVKTPDGSLEITVATDAGHLGHDAYNTPDVSVYNIPCGYRLMDAFMSTPPDHAAHWSKCTSTPLPDGSKVDSASTPDGDGVVSVAIREYPNNGGGIAVIWTDYANWRTMPGDSALTHQTPDPSVVLKPNPFSEQRLAAVLGGPQFGPTSTTSTSKPVGNGPKQFLKTGDLGTGAAYDPSSSNGSTGDLPMDNGCDYKDVNPLAKPGRAAVYTATTPSGKKVTVSELEYPLPSGTGPATMATARSQAEGGCDQHVSLYSKDTAKDLPAGIGDQAFVENGVGTGAVTVWMRFGDTILRLDVMQDHAMPDLSAPADQAWLQNVAEAAAGHWRAKD